MAVGRIALWCAEDGFDLEVPDDAEADAKAIAARVRASYRTNDHGRVLVEQRAVEVDGRSTAKTGCSSASASLRDPAHLSNPSTHRVRRSGVRSCIATRPAPLSRVSSDRRNHVKT